jgi:hypothetical protein
MHTCPSYPSRHPLKRLHPLPIHAWFVPPPLADFKDGSKISTNFKGHDVTVATSVE